MKRKILSLILSISLIFSNQSINCFAETYGNETTIEELNQSLTDPNFLKEQITKFIILRKIIKFGTYLAITALSGFLGYTILRMIREQKYQARNYLNTIIKEKDSTIDTAISQLKIQAVKNSNFNNAMNSFQKEIKEIKDTMENSELKNVVSNTVNSVVNSAMNALHKKEIKEIMENSELKNIASNTINNVVSSAMDALHQKEIKEIMENSELKNVVSNTVNNVVNSAMNSLHQKEIKEIMENSELKSVASNTVYNVVNSAMNSLHQKDLDTLQANLNTLNDMENLELNIYTPREIHLYKLLKNALSNNDIYKMTIEKLKEKNALLKKLLKAKE